MTADAVVADLARAHQAARSGDVATARACMDRVRPYAHLSNDLRQVLGMLEYLCGDAAGAAATLRSVTNPRPETVLAMSEAQRALGNGEISGALRAHAYVEMHKDTTQCVEVYLREDNYAFHLPAQPTRNWGSHMRKLECGDYAGAAREIFAGGDLLPPYALGARALRLRTGKMLPRWDGKPVGRLAVLLADGHGDAFLFGRYIRPLQRYAKALTVIVSTPVHPLAVRCFPDIEIATLSGCGDALARSDAYINEWPLPGLCDVGRGDAVWIAPDPELVEKWRPKGAGLHVGVVWNGCLSNMHDNLRSIPIEALAPLWDVPGVTWHSLQYGPKAAEAPPCMIDYSTRLKSFHDTAALITGLDLVIAVDTAVANLAGAMGAPVWALIEKPGANDFRWTGDAQCTPWFPSACVFRQDDRGTWAPVIERVRERLGGLASTTARPSP